MPEKRRSLDPPVEVDNQTGVPARAGAAGPPVGERQNVLTMDGRFDACDVAVNLPAEWGAVGLSPAATFELRGEVRGATYVLDRRSLADLDATPAGGAGRITGLLFAIRGRMVSRFIVDVFLDSTQVRPTGEFTGRAWFSGGRDGDRSLRQPGDPYCFPWQQVTSSIGPLGVGAAVFFAANPDGGRTSIPEWTVDNDGAVPATVELVRVTATGTPTTVKHITVPAMDTRQIHFPVPVRCTRGGSWRVVVIAGGAVFASSTAYQD